MGHVGRSAVAGSVASAAALAVAVFAAGAVGALLARNGIGPALLASAAMALIGAVVTGAAAYRRRRTIAGLRRRAAEAALGTSVLDMYAGAQDRLEAHVDRVRRSLQALGEPSRRGDELLFGDTVVNGASSILDRVKSELGGSATLFLGDRRICTSVVGRDGARALGAPLAPGPAYDAVLKQGRAFRGEVDILGEAHFSLYEPIVCAGEVIGALSAAVPKSDFAAASREAEALLASGDDLEALSRALALFQDSLATREAVSRAVDQRRQEAADLQRRHVAAGQSAASAQQLLVETLSADLRRVAGGDLSRPLDPSLGPEYAGLRASFNSAVKALARALADAGDRARSLRRDASGIERTAEDLAYRTEQQAVGLREAGATLGRLAQSVKAGAEGAARVEQTVQQACSDAEKSDRLVDDAVTAMGEIKRSASQIDQIIGVIEEIAFQTSLLALNAGVEAARAGDAGRGFAVVASEVRALAQRSSDAAKEIKTLLSTSGAQVQRGVELVDRTGSALRQIAVQVGDIAVSIGAMASAAREQAEGLGEVNQSVGRLDRASLQSVDVVAQAAAASRQLGETAEDLAALIDQFALPPSLAKGRVGRAA